MRNPGAAIRQSGASLLEFAVAVIVVSILATVLFEHLFFVQEFAEKTEMELMISNLHSATRIKVGEYLIADRGDEISTLAGANPVPWLDSRPENYLGAYQGAPDSDVAGRWYFDTIRRELVYTANLHDHFVPSVTGSGTSPDYTVRVRVELLASAPGSDEPAWVRAVSSEYQWF